MKYFGLIGSSLGVLIGKLLDGVNGIRSARDEKNLQTKFAGIMEQLHGAGGNTHQPVLGSPEYWDAEKMVERGWLVRSFPDGYMRAGFGGFGQQRSPFS